MPNEFGGIWTRKKIQALEAYLKFYATALKDQPFELHYVDAFAGTGSHRPVAGTEQELLMPVEDIHGSVNTALKISPGFDTYHFNDLDPQNVAQLEAIKESHTDKVIEIYQQDANDFVPQFCANLKSNARAVLFLDPYSTQLNWNTLKHVADSKKVDLWMLFPISVIMRMTPKDGSRIIPAWKNTLDRLIGKKHYISRLKKHLWVTYLTQSPTK